MTFGLVWHFLMRQKLFKNGIYILEFSLILLIWHFVFKTLNIKNTFLNFHAGTLK